MLLDVLDRELLEGVRAALAEDVGGGDLTADLVPAGTTAAATVVCRESAVLCGMAWFNAVFAELDNAVVVEWLARDGDPIEPDRHICTVSGPAAAILTGERTALNFLQTLSGTATLARQYARAVEGLAVKILDTRKTVPGLRMAQKYAVRTGGCHNHRLGLHDGILIKENHIAAAGSIGQAIHAARSAHPGIPVEVEVENPAQVDAALAAGADRLLLDNFSIAGLTATVERVAGRATLEASGGVELENLRAVAATGVDLISIGALTKNIHAIDFSMLFEDTGSP